MMKKLLMPVVLFVVTLLATQGWAKTTTFDGTVNINTASIEELIQASTAIPGFYKPARIKGVDYIDGGVRRTANIDIAFEKGADLTICYNPFRPFKNEVVLEFLREEKKYVTKAKRLSDWGIGMVLNQVFRTLFHSRLMYAVQTYREDPKFKRDLMLIEPEEDDTEFFELNPLFFWNRAKAASQGFKSVSLSIEENYDKVSSMLAKYGIETTRDVIQMGTEKMESSKFDDKVVMDVLENKHAKKHLKVMQGGKRHK